jgi:hypothetical protein
MSPHTSLQQQPARPCTTPQRRQPGNRPVQVSAGSYKAITVALPEVAEKYPGMCYTFLNGLTLRPLGEMEIPASVHFDSGRIVRAASSYTSVKEMWATKLQLEEVRHVVLSEHARCKLYVLLQRVLSLLSRQRHKICFLLDE